jgi:hypothetical protein
LADTDSSIYAIGISGHITQLPGILLAKTVPPRHNVKTAPYIHIESYGVMAHLITRRQQLAAHQRQSIVA